MDNKKKIWVSLGILVLVLVVIFAFNNYNNKDNSVKISRLSTKTQQASKTTSNPKEADTSKASTTKALTKEDLALQEAVTVVPGANPISKENKVLTTTGKVVKTDVSADSGLAPQQTLAISEKSLPKSVIKIEETAKQGFNPTSFTVKAGTPVTISLTNKESGRSATLAFVDPSLSAVILGVGASETRAITFNAPSKSGDYKFIDGIPGHTASGIMTVK